MITFANDFHNTAVRVRAQVGDNLSVGQCRRIRYALCGMADCHCAPTDLGIRGPQPDGFTVEIGMPLYDEFPAVVIPQ
jgi:hypothetical protein